MAGLENHAVRSDIELGVVQVFDRLNHGCNQIGATADGLCQNDVRLLCVAELSDRFNQLIKVAAKTCSGNLTNVESLRSQCIGIDKIVSLVVRHNADTMPLPDVPFGKPPKGRCLTGSQEPADHDVANAMAHSVCFLIAWLAQVYPTKRRLALCRFVSGPTVAWVRGSLSGSLHWVSQGLTR